MEKTIRNAESRIQEQLTLTRIRKIAKIFGGAIFIIGLSLFLFGLLGTVTDIPFSSEFIKQLNFILLIFCGLLIFISGLLHLTN